MTRRQTHTDSFTNVHYATAAAMLALLLTVGQLHVEVKSSGQLQAVIVLSLLGITLNVMSGYMNAMYNDEVTGAHWQALTFAGALAMTTAGLALMLFANYLAPYIGGIATMGALAVVFPLLRSSIGGSEGRRSASRLCLPAGFRAFGAAP